MSGYLETAKAVMREHRGSVAMWVPAPLPAIQAAVLPTEATSSNSAITVKQGTAESEPPGIQWARWKAAMLNQLFRDQGLTGQMGRITPETVRHGAGLP